MAATKRRGPAGHHAGMSDAAVASRTGKGWDEWFALIDRAGARELDHAAIARHLHAKHKVAGWWAQMITVAWEQARGRRVKHQRTDGFGVSATRTLPASRAELWKSLTDAKRRGKWVVAPKWEVSSQKPPARMSVRWKDGTLVEFRLTPKGAGRCQIAAEHTRLKDAQAAAAMKACWGQALDHLGRLLESAPRARR